MESSYFIYHSPIGAYRVEYIGEAVVGVAHIPSSQSSVADDAYHCSQNSFTQVIARQLTEYFLAERKEFDIAIDYSRCTPFQRRVYEQLLKIPYGQTRSYKQIATAIGDPNAARAVGSANNRNPIAILIPCHRVIGSGGALTGYAAGLDVKTFLLQLEANDRFHF